MLSTECRVSQASSYCNTQKVECRFHFLLKRLLCMNNHPITYLFCKWLTFTLFLEDCSTVPFSYLGFPRFLGLEWLHTNWPLSLTKSHRSTGTRLKSLFLCHVCFLVWTFIVWSTYTLLSAKFLTAISLRVETYILVHPWSPKGLIASFFEYGRKHKHYTLISISEEGGIHSHLPNKQSLRSFSGITDISLWLM